MWIPAFDDQDDDKPPGPDDWIYDELWFQLAAYCDGWWVPVMGHC